MPIAARINWDEENSPCAFYWCWGLSEISLSICAALVKAHILDSVALMRPANPLPERSAGFLLLVLLLCTASLYLNLLLNGIFHQNPDLADSKTRDRLHEGSPDADNTTTGGSLLFSQAILKNNDPVIVRDQIQWGRMALATLAAIAMSLPFIAVVA